MGTWNTSVTGNDTAEDLYIEYTAAFYKFDVEEALKRIDNYIRAEMFDETYKDDEFVSALLTQISWTNHLMIMSKSKTKEERDFYIELSAKEHYSSRELERQLDSSYYERYMLSSGKQEPELVPQNVRSSILDTYVLELSWIYYTSKEV